MTNIPGMVDGFWWEGIESPSSPERGGWVKVSLRPIRPYFPGLPEIRSSLEAARPNLLGKGVEPRIHLLPEPIASPKSTLRSEDEKNIPGVGGQLRR